jgi:hypothetical protein
MNINRGLFIIGIILALIGFGASFLINSIVTPRADTMIAARIDIAAGTIIGDLPDDTFVTVPIQFPNESAQQIMNAIMRPQDLSDIQRANGVFINNVYKYEPILLSSIVSAENPAAIRIVQLSLDDPDMIIITIPANNNVPEGIREGDRVDLAVAVNSVGKPVEVEKTESQSYAYQTGTIGGIQPEALVAALEAAGYTVTAPQERTQGQATEVGAEPTATPLPEIREPIAKVLVHGAQVVSVRRESSLAGLTTQGETTLTLGEIIGLDLVIPRDAFEFVTMAANGGILQIGMLSPVAVEELDQPTLGASLQDLLDLFYADRERLATPAPHTETPLPKNTALPTAIPHTPTPTGGAEETGTPAS